MNQFDMAITADRLRGRRKELGLIQSEVAERAGITPQALSTYENGSIPRMDILLPLADALECEPDFLLGRIKHPTREVSKIADQIPLSRTAIEGLLKLKEVNDKSEDTFVLTRAIDYMICGMLDSAGYSDPYDHYEDYQNNQFYPLLFDLIDAISTIKKMDEESVEVSNSNPDFGKEWNQVNMARRGIRFEIGIELANIIDEYVSTLVYKSEEI